MFASVMQFKFSSLSEAKIAAGFFSEGLGGKIADYDFHGLNIMLGKDGEVTVAVRFEEAMMLKKFEKESPQLVEEIKSAFACKQSKFSGVCIYSFEREAVSSAIPTGDPVHIVTQ